MEMLDRLVAPWARLYSESSTVSNLVVWLHLAGILWGGGRAITADVLVVRSSGLEAFREQPGLEFLRASHRQVLSGLAVIVLSGLLMVLADRAHFFGSSLYWVKMGAVGVLVVNGAIMTRVVAGLEAASSGERWRQLRRGTAVSLLSWMMILGLGVSL